MSEPRFSKKSLNIIIFVTLIMILLFSQMSPSTKDAGEPALDQSEAPESQAAGQSASVSGDFSDEKAASESSMASGQDNLSEKASKEVPFSLESLKGKLKSVQQVDLTVASSAQLEIDHWISDKGARVYYVNAPEIPIVDVRLVFDAGSARDKALPGLANLTNALLSQGTENYLVDDLLSAFEASGIEFSTGAYRDMALVSFRVLAIDQYLDKATDLVAEVVGKPSFPEEHLNRLLSQYKIGLEREKQVPGLLMNTRFYAELYADHSYGIRSSGTSESLEQIKLSHLAQFYQRHYVARNLVIAIVGAIDKKQAEKRVEALTSFLEPGQPAEQLPEPAPLKSLRHEHIPFESDQTHISLAALAIDKLNPDYYPLYLGNYILGGSGFSSLLNLEIRQARGLSYSVASGVIPMRKSGPFKVSLQTKRESASEALNVTMDTIKRFVEEGPTEEELKRAKQELMSGFPLMADNNASVLGYIASIGFYGLSLDYLAQYNSKIGSVTGAEIKSAFKKYIDPEKFLIVTLGGEKPSIR